MRPNIDWGGIASSMITRTMRSRSLKFSILTDDVKGTKSSANTESLLIRSNILALRGCIAPMPFITPERKEKFLLSRELIALH